MKRIGLGLAWLAASYLGTAAAAWVDLPRVQPAVVIDAVYFAPMAALLIFLIRDLKWALVVVAGLCVLALSEHFLRPVVNAIARPLAPVPTVPLPPRSAYLPAWMVYFAAFGVITGVVEFAFLWPYLKPAWMWPVFKVIGGLSAALIYLWRPYVPVPGAPNAGWDWAGTLITTIGLVLLWQFGARAPNVRWPTFRLSSRLEDEVDPAYAARMAELESSLLGPSQTSSSN